jgi:glycosyltransferase involved in cell wall biosynthesis
MTALPGRPRIAWFVDSATTQTLSSYCSELLLPLLSSRFDIELFTDAVCLDARELPVHHYLTAYRRHHEAPFDLFFYQLEDGKPGRFARTHLGLLPGIVWVHDLYLQDHGPEGLYTSPWERTVAQFRDSEVPFFERACAPHQLWPRACREVSLAPVLLFSSRWAMRDFSTFISERIEPYPGGQRVEFLPVPVTVEGEASRRLNSSVLRLASIGTVNVEDRAYKILPALREAICECHLTWLVDSHEVLRARELIEEFSVRERVTLVEGRTVQRWREILGTSDVALHMHRSPFGHLAPYLQFSLAAGIPVVVSDAAEGAQLAQNCVFRVVPGVTEAAELAELFGSLSKISLESIGRRGREYVESESEVSRVAERLVALFHQSLPGMKHCSERWESLQQRASRALIEEVLSLAGDAPAGCGAEQILVPIARELGWIQRSMRQ